MIRMISIPRLRLAQLQTLTESSLRIATPITEVATQVADVQAAYDKFLEGIQKDQAASDKQTLDKTRDRLISGFMLDVRAEDNFPHDDAALLTTIKEVRRITDKYGLAINRLPYDEQSAQVDNLLGEIEKIDMTNLPKISRWAEPIRTANDAFKSASTDYIKEVVASSQMESASAVAPDLLTKLEGLFTLLFAHAQVTPSEELTQAYLELSASVDTYR